MVPRAVIILLSVALLPVAPGVCQVLVTSADDRGVTFEYLPEPIVSSSSLGTIELALRDGEQLYDPGLPILPRRVVVVAVPPGSHPTARILQTQPGASWEGRLPVAPMDSASLPSVRLNRSQRSQLVSLLGMRSLAGMNVTYLSLNPASYSQSPPRVSLAGAMTVRVDFNAPSQTAVRRTVPPSAQTRGVVINTDQAAHWGRLQSGNFTTASWPSGYLYRFQIDREGIYKLTFDQLKQSGVSEIGSGVPSENVRLFGNGGNDLPLDPSAEAPLGLAECPIFVADGGDNLFGPGDYLLFYGRGAGGWGYTPNGDWEYRIHHYDVHNQYWLVLDPSGSGLRMQGFSTGSPADTTVTAALAGYYYEPEQFIYGASNFRGSGRDWYGYTFDGVSRYSFTLRIDSPDATQPATLKLRIVYGTTPAGNIEVSVNNNFLARFVPDFHTYLGVESYEVSADYLHDGANIITFAQTDPGARVLFDWLELTWQTDLNRPDAFFTLPYNGTVEYRFSDIDNPWLFDITEHNMVGLERRDNVTVSQQIREPKRLMLATPATFLSVASPFEEYLPPTSDYSIGNLWSTANRCDVLLITPDSYFEAAKPLIDHYVRRTPPLSAAAVRLSEIYNRFSGGLRDPAAIRNMLMFAQDNWENPPDYVVFCGDGDYNYRDIDRPASPDLLPPYEEGSLSSDDWFVDFTPYVDDSVPFPLPEMIHGRLTAGSARELEDMVAKIIAYQENPEFGLWRNNVTLVADDEFGENYNAEDEHVRYTEDLSANYIPSNFDRNKIYLTEYQREWGREKPKAGDDLVASINRGTLLVNYMGHGNPTLWAHEHVFVLSRDLSRIEPSRRQALYIAFTCDWAYWDDASAQSFPEQLLAMPDGGASSIVASTRLTWGGSNMSLARNFFANLFASDTATVGWALFRAKHLYSGSNSASYHLLGDPAMHLGYPRMQGRFTAPAEFSFTPLELSSIAGDVLGQTGVPNPDFQGTLDLIALDTQVPRTYLIALYRDGEIIGYITLHYNLSGPIIYRGLLSVAGGRFQGRFIVPKDVTLGGQLGRVLAYFHNDDSDGIVVHDSVAYAAQVAAGSDTLPPNIQIYFDHRGYRAGDRIGPEPLLLVDLADSSGLNLTGAMGHGIALTIDGGAPVDLTPYFSYHLDSYQSGTLERPLEPLTPGTHRFEIEAWDSYDNLAIAGMDVEVIAGGAGLVVDRILNYPNPFNSTTALTFVVNRPVEYELLVYTVGGRLIRDFRGRAPYAGMISDAIWDARDRAGREVGNGVYLLKVKARDDDGNEANGIGKMVYAR